MHEDAGFFTMEFQRAKFKSYMNKDPNTFFTQQQRILIVWDVLERTTVSGRDVLLRQSPLLKGHSEDEVSSESHEL